MSLEVQYHDRAVPQSQAPWKEAHPRATLLEPPLVSADPPTQDIVTQVLPPTRLHGYGPLQEHAGLIDVGDGIPWSRGGRWETDTHTHRVFDMQSGFRDEGH